ncbi:MAG: hypothetical protein KIT31_02665 [Deltaproteobacteria bacterium]|nr:hypothetical protein [Deltaproteobacteria bacterium]
MRWLVFALLLGCGNSSTEPASPATSAEPNNPAAPAKGSAGASAVAPATPPKPCTTKPLPRLEAGAEKGQVCDADVASPLVVLDLADAWTPALFAQRPDGSAPEFRENYLRIASELDGKGKLLPPHDALAELYGVVPSLAIVRARLADEKRHACHAAIDSSTITTIDKAYTQADRAEVMRGHETRAALQKQLERERDKRKVADLAALADVPETKASYEKWKKLDDRYRGLVAIQKHLACEGYLPAKRAADGNMSWEIGTAVELFQRRNFLMPNATLDAETRAAFALDSRELDFRFALRVLRERVADAAGLVEDGTAGEGPVAILGRMLDPADMRRVRGYDKPLPNAAPDLISPATEAAAKALGWTDPAATLASMKAHADQKVVVQLPPPPAYHAAHMALEAEIDRGDVWYDMKPTWRAAVHRPNLVLYADDHGTRRALMRWPTTIGGWADQRPEAPKPAKDGKEPEPAPVDEDGEPIDIDSEDAITRQWKESDVGERVWRDIYAAPTWMPPMTTPDRELLVHQGSHKYALKKSSFGPGPHAAFGMVLIQHQIIEKKKDGKESVWDNGIGTHGAASVTSVVTGSSHGCHRMFNQYAVRLGDFLLKHREHVVKGQMPTGYTRTLTWKPPPPPEPKEGDPPVDPEKLPKTQTFTAKVKTRGYLYQLNPPVKVNVLPGNILTSRTTPPPPYKPEKKKRKKDGEDKAADATAPAKSEAAKTETAKPSKAKSSKKSTTAQATP